MNGHSYIGASSAARWIACPGSVNLYKQLTSRKATIYAATGTVAHEIGESCLRDGGEPSDFLGQTFTQDGFTVPVTEDMVAAVTLYVEQVRSDHKRYGGTLLVEQPFDLSWVYPGMFGRNDSSIIPAEIFGTLRVYDYKNGRSNVDAEANPQAMYYAVGALGEHNLSCVERVELNIIQPNASDGGHWHDQWEICVDDLYQWTYDVLRPAAIEAFRPDAPLREGDQCTFCEASAFCPLKQSKALAMFEKEPDAPLMYIDLPEVQSLAPERIGLLSAFFNSPEFDQWRKSLAAEEQAMLARGETVPGRKLVESIVRGNRKWSDEESAIVALKEYGDEIFKQDLKTPAQIEKLLSANGLSKKEREAIVSPLVTRETTTKLIVVPESDERPAIAEQRENIIDMFNDNEKEN